MSVPSAVDSSRLGPDNPTVPIATSRRSLILLLALFVLVGAAVPILQAQGCSMCREATGGADDPLGRALHWSTLFMVAMPFVVAGLIAGYVGLAQRRALRREPQTSFKPALDRSSQSMLSPRRSS